LKAIIPLFSGYLCPIVYMAFLLFATPARSQTIASSTTTMVVNSSGSCVDVNGGSKQIGLGIDQWQCTGTSNQNFIFSPTIDGYYTIQALINNLCLDAGSGSVTTALQIVQNTCAGSNSQKWKVVPNSNGSYVVTTANGLGCFDVYAGRKADGTSVTTYACHGSDNESFRMSGFHSPPTPGQTAGAFVSPLVVISSSSCVDVIGNSNQPNTGIDQWACNSAANQSFLFNPTPDGYYTIQPQNDNLCLDSGAGSMTNAVTVVQNTCSGGSSQKWKLRSNSDGSYAIATAAGVGCLDVYGGFKANGTAVTTYPCHQSDNESFRLTGYSPPASQLSAPVIAPASGAYGAPIMVVMSESASGASIYYTTDGTTPNAGSKLYTGPFSVTSSTSIQAIAIAGSIKASSVVSVQYSVQVSAAASNLPIVLNFSPGAQPGDVIYVQGANFDSSSQVWLANGTSSAATQLPIVNRVSSTWLGAQLPQTWTGAMFLFVSNAVGSSGKIKLNGAIPFNLDALEIVPGGAFRILGRNLLVSGYKPSVMVDGAAATVNTAASTANMLLVTAPSTLNQTSHSVILIDNGNGTGPTQLDRTITVASGFGDPLGLGVGWAAGFSFVGNTVKANTPCNGSSDDSGNIQNAINSAARSGGIVQLPVGTCVLASTLTMRSNVVIQGAGKTATVLKYFSNYPIYSENSNLVGLRNFTLVNANGTMEGLIWKNNTRSFFQNIKVQEGVSRQLYLTGNENFIVTQTDFVQGGSVNSQNPFLFTDCAGFVFSNNTSLSVDGSPTFQHVHDAVILNNHFTRDAVNQNESSVITTHQFVMDFAYRIAIIGNTFDVVHGPITNTVRNDGETLLTEGGGANRTENYGTVNSATSNTLNDPQTVVNTNPFGTGLPENYGVAIVSGTGVGQTREMVAYAGSAIQVDHAWDILPDSTSRYATFVWGLEKALIEGNTLTDNPRGIWLYQTATRDVDISGNRIVNGGGIYLRTFEDLNARMFDAMYNVRVANNSIVNSNGLWMSYITAVFVNKDQTNFGTALTGVDIRSNNLTANIPNVSSSVEDYASQEGFMDVMRSETTGGQVTAVPMILGTLFQNNQCSNCQAPFVVGTGDYGTILMGNSPAANSPSFLTDWQVLGSTQPGSVKTLVK
jgi:hypothetical protein